MIGPVTGRRRIPHAAIAASIVVAIQLLHGPATFFLYDAAQYWEGAVALATGGDVASAGELGMRGALTPLVYLIPAALSPLFGATALAWVVLVWNALLAALLCAIVLPRLASSLIGAKPNPLLYALAVVSGLVVSGFSRYPLLDVWAATAALGGLVLLLSASRWYTWVGAGALLVISANLRPSYLVPVLLVLVIIAFTRRSTALWVIPGAAIALIPQLAVNVSIWGSWSLLPTGTAVLTRIQAAQSAYVVRYDTVIEAGRSPQQFYCDPGFASGLVGSPPPGSPLELAVTFLGHLPESVWFLVQKIAASLAWSLSTPYEASPDGRLGPVAVAVTVVAAMGLVALVLCIARGRSVAGARTAGLVAGSFWIGSLATLAMSTPETRFALPLVLTGLVAIAAVAARVRRPRNRSEWALAAGAAVGTAGLTLGLLVSTLVGLQYAVPPGPLADAAQCAMLIE